MKRTLAILFLSLAVLIPTGCDSLIGLLQLDIVTVVMINEGNDNIEGELYYASEQLLPREAIIAGGERVNFDLRAGETFVFSRDCDDLQAILIADADVQSVFGQNESTSTLRDGTDFNCGDRITYRFRYNDLGLNFDIDQDVN